MGSKLIGFRISSDLAEQVEAKAAGQGLSTSEYLRGLVDEALYPSKPDMGEVEKAELEEMIDVLKDKYNELVKVVNSNGKLVEQGFTTADDWFGLLFQVVDALSHAANGVVIPAFASEAADLWNKRVTAADESRGKLPILRQTLFTEKPEGIEVKYLPNLNVYIRKGK